MPTPLARLLWWDAMVNDRTLVNRDGALMACVRFRGPDLHAALDTVLVVQAEHLNNCFRRFDGTWGLLTEARRREVREYPPSTCTNPAARLVDEERGERFRTPGLHYATECTLTLTQRQPRAATGAWKHWLYTDLPQERQQGGVLAFEAQVRRTLALLSEACEDVTLLEARATLTYLHSTVSWKDYTVKVPDPACYLNTYLSDTDLERVRVLPSLLRWPRLGGKYLRCVTAKVYPTQTDPGLLDVLETVPLEYRATIRYRPMSRAKAIRAAQEAGDAHWGQRHRGTSKSRTEKAAVERAEAAGIAQEGVELGHWGSGPFVQTVVVWDENFTAAAEKAETVEAILNNAGYTAKVEGVNTMRAWHASLPGTVPTNPRETVMTTRNLAHLVPVRGQVRGPHWNRHLNGPPLLYVTGRGHTPFALDLHDDDVAHTFIVGPTGSGKSFLVSLLCMQWLKYPGAQVYALDKDQSLRCATYAVGGQWYDIGAELERDNATGTPLDDMGMKPLWLPPPGWWQCFEMASLLKTPEIIPRVVGPLLRQMEARLTGVPSLISLDEAWVYLRNDFLRGKIQDYLLTLRKANGTVLFSTQNLEHIIGSEIGSDIYQSCVNKIFLANPQALKPAVGKLYRDLGLTERQCTIIATLTRKKHYYYSGPYGDCVFELGAGPITIAFNGAGRKEDLAALEQVYTRAPGNFAANWLRYRGLEEAAVRLERGWKDEDAEPVA